MVAKIFLIPLLVAEVRPSEAVGQFILGRKDQGCIVIVQLRGGLDLGQGKIIDGHHMHGLANISQLGPAQFIGCGPRC